MADAPARRLLPPSQMTAKVVEKGNAFHPAIVDEVEAAMAGSPIVVVGMAQNPNCGRVRKALTQGGFEFKYIEYGSYLSKWKERLAIKLWSGWPTFPQVFVRGVLIGGADFTEAAIADGSLKAMLVAPSPTPSQPLTNGESRPHFSA
jgi:monothiol glutaredoxin